MWINGVPLPDTTTSVLAYLIWKDYNCHTWRKMSSIFSAKSSFTASQQTKMNTYLFNGLDTDIWRAAYTFVDYISAQTLFNTGGYSAVFSQHTNPIIFGYICIVNLNYYYKISVTVNGTTSKYGYYFIFQTRLQ